MIREKTQIRVPVKTYQWNNLSVEKKKSVLILKWEFQWYAFLLLLYNNWKKKRFSYRVGLAFRYVSLSFKELVTIRWSIIEIHIRCRRTRNGCYCSPLFDQFLKIVDKYWFHLNKYFKESIYHTNIHLFICISDF